MNTELRALTDNELDAVSGAVGPIVALVMGAAFGIGAAIGEKLVEKKGTLRPLNVPKS